MTCILSKLKTGGAKKYSEQKNQRKENYYSKDFLFKINEYDFVKQRTHFFSQECD
jgi:hypothetical protein